jgi:carbamoyltransferase
MKKILGISAFYHDSAAAILVNGEVIAAVQEERFTRDKHTEKFPVNSIKYCLEETGLTLNELDAIVFYDKPLLKFERLLETYYAFAPKGLWSFIKAIPVWVKEKLFLKKMIFDGLMEVGHYDKNKLKLLFPEHHLSHAASTFFVSPFHESAILTIDGVGEWTTASIGYGTENKIEFKKELNFPHSVGLLYSAFTYYLGFTVNSGEYKLMGLAPYGDPNSSDTLRFIELIKKHLVDIKSDGSIWLDQSYFDYSTGMKMTNNAKWKKIFGFSRREEESELEQYHCDLALAIQKVTEEIVLKMAKEAKRITQSNYLCLSGGVALNCVANGVLSREKIFEKIFITPASGDAGGALGAALTANYIYFDEPRLVNTESDSLKGSYLGPSYSDKEIELMIRKTKAISHKIESEDELVQFSAKKLAEGEVVGWFQGRMEFGPRALGNRSILGDARNPEMQKKINLKIKYREGFRPFAPSVLKEDANLYFDMEEDSPYMLLVSPVSENMRYELPENYFNLSLWDRLYTKRSKIQSVTHLDYSARVQTVTTETNQRYWKLINSFKEITGIGVVVNTSFNVRGEPIVCTPYDAYRCFMSTDMDVLVINNYIFIKKEQEDWENKDKWIVNFKMD